MGKLPGSLCTVTALPHLQKISFQPGPSPTYRHLPTYLLRSEVSSGLQDGMTMGRDASVREKAGRTWGRQIPAITCGIQSLSVLDGPPFPPTCQATIIFVLPVLRSETRQEPLPQGTKL